MHPFDFASLQKKTAFAEAIHIVKTMGLERLALIRCAYNAQLVMQFFATLVIKGDSKKTMKWMTGESYCESNFEEFAKVLGYRFDGDNPQGTRMHTEGDRVQKTKKFLPTIS